MPRGVKLTSGHMNWLFWPYDENLEPQGHFSDFGLLSAKVVFQVLYCIKLSEKKGKKSWKQSRQSSLHPTTNSQISLVTLILLAYYIYTTLSLSLHRSNASKLLRMLLLDATMNCKIDSYSFITCKVRVGPGRKSEIFENLFFLHLWSIRHKIHK